MKPISVSFCSGIGGFDKGAKLGGFETIYQSDIWKAAQSVFHHNYKGKSKFPADDYRTTEGVFELMGIDIANFESIQKFIYENSEDKRFINRGDVDLMLSGSPCQGMSGVNPYANSFNFTNRLMLDQLRIANDLQVKVALFEQVPGFLHDRIKDFRLEFTGMLDKMDKYTYIRKELNAMKFGAGQDRNRVIFMLVRKDIGLASFPPKHKEVNKAYHLDRLFPQYHYFKEAGSKGEPKETRNTFFNTMTASGNYYFYNKDGEQSRMTIDEKLKVSKLEGYDLSCLDERDENGKRLFSESDKGKLIGNMVQIDFAKALTEHIRINILKR